MEEIVRYILIPITSVLYITYDLKTNLERDTNSVIKKTKNIPPIMIVLEDIFEIILSVIGGVIFFSSSEYNGTAKIIGLVLMLLFVPNFYDLTHLSSDKFQRIKFEGIWFKAVYPACLIIYLLINFKNLSF